MALSDQLTDLAGKTKQLEDTAAAAKAQNRAKLEKERDKLHSDMQSEAKKLQAGADKSKADAQTWWADMAARAEQQRKDLHAKIEERKSERKVDRAMHQADDAESYAASMIQAASYCIDAAEYAVADAVIARGQADDLVMAS
jgi:RNA polymerase-binding transcription factor DksA